MNPGTHWTEERASYRVSPVETRQQRSLGNRTPTPTLPSYRPVSIRLTRLPAFHYAPFQQTGTYTSAKSIKWRNPTRQLNFWVHICRWDPRTLNYTCEHFSTSDHGDSIAKYGDQGCLQMIIHKLEAYDDTNLCTNDVACLSVRSISRTVGLLDQFACTAEKSIFWYALSVTLIPQGWERFEKLTHLFSQ